MPGQRVYGKRSRVVGEAFAAFVSPERQTPEGTKHVEVAQLTEELSKLAVKDGKTKKTRSNKRSALGEVDANTVVTPIIPVAVRTTKRPRARRKAVVDEEEDYAAKEETAATETLKTNVDAKANPPAEQRIVSGDNFESVTGDGSELVGPTTKDVVLYQETDGHDCSASIPPSTTHCPNEYHKYCAELLKLSVHGMTKFDDWSNQLSNHFSITKIAEASFAEVYRLSMLESIPEFVNTDESVFKIIPLRPPEGSQPTARRKRDEALKHLETMSSPGDVANEIKLLQRMSTIPGFTNFRDVRVIQGRPPQPFIKAYKTFNAGQKARKTELSHFPDPSKKNSYTEDQLWAVIEMQDAGMDLERLLDNGECGSIWQIWDIFWQVVLSIAKGEEGAEFEHRDLHLGNICARQPLQHPNEALEIKRKLNFTGIETTVIDYTISRALMADDTIAYHDLSRDSGLFEGDSTDEYQYDIYRYMRGAFLLNDPYADFSREIPNHSERTWQQYRPITNAVWLHFILYKLLEHVEWPSAKRAPPRKQKEKHAGWKRANELEKVLLRVQDLLDPGVICTGDVRSATDLVGLALKESWLEVEDVVGEGVDETGLVSQLEGLDLHVDAIATVIQSPVREQAKNTGRSRRNG